VTTAVNLRRRLYVSYWALRAWAGLGSPLSGLRLLAQSERWPRERVDSFRDAKLRSLVAHAYAHTRHYRRVMDERGLTPGDIRGATDLAKLPVLTKEILRERADELRAPGFGPIEEGVTGGTTGAPTRVVRDAAGTIWQRGCYWRGLGWGGLTLGAPWVQLFGGSLGVGAARPMNGVKNWLAGKTFLPAFELAPDNVARYVQAIERSGARHLVGYASACHLLATLVERAGLRLALEAVFPTAEVLPPEWAERMRHVFGARVLPYYGCGEIQSLGYSCPEGGGYHTCDEHAILEVETGGAAALTGEGALLVTDLDNRAMPLLRYRNGDAGVVTAPGCACGRTLGKIERLDGRVNDVLLTLAGERVSGAIGPHAFRTTRGVEAYQIVQRQPGQATLRIVRGQGYDPALEESRLRKVFRDHLGRDAEIQFEYVAEVARTAAGKARFVINEYLQR
jgi:phenylacetate-CoA ligase